MWKPRCPSSYHQVRANSHLFRILFPRYLTGYETDEKTFLEIVERDAAGFKPPGEKIHSYQRLSPSSRGKGKSVASAADLDAGSEDIIEYEVYHVSIRFLWAVFWFPALNLRLVDMGYSRVQGVPPKNAIVHPPLY